MGALQGGYPGAAALGGGGGSGLASEEAFRGFARGAAIQQQQAQNAEAAQLGFKPGMVGRIREVWANNLEQEMTILRQLVQKYPFVSMVSPVMFGEVLHGCILTPPGRRVSRHRRAADREFRKQGLVPLPDFTLQRRSAPAYTARHHTLVSRRRASAITSRFEHHLQVTLRQQPHDMSMHMVIQLCIQPRG